MRSRRRWMLSFAIVGAALLTGCRSDATIEVTSPTTSTSVAAATTASTSASTTTPASAPKKLVVWVDGSHVRVVEAVAAAFGEATGTAVHVEGVGLDEIKRRVESAGPEAEGPDLFVGSHRWTGELAVGGVIDAIELGDRVGDYFEVAVDAFNFEGRTYGVPYSIEAIALYYNTDLVERPPRTFEEVGSMCDALAAIEACVGVPGGGDQPDGYHNYPFVSALGGYVFAFDPASGYDVNDVGLDSNGALAGIRFLADMVADGVVASTDYSTAKSLFLAGKEPFWITGPWERAELAGQEVIHWSAAKLPTITGAIPHPFVDAQGFFLSASGNEELALPFLLDYLATTDTMTQLYEADPRSPAMKAVVAGLGRDDVARTFALSAIDGTPMPGLPQMNLVWGPLGDSLLLVRNGVAMPDDVMRAAAAVVRSNVEP